MRLLLDTTQAPCSSVITQGNELPQAGLDLRIDHGSDESMTQLENETIK